MIRRRTLPTTSYAVLGLLDTTSMSGYELARFVDESIAHFWPISKSQVYGELARLEDLGYLEGTDVEQEKVPDKRVFSLTPAGKEGLDAWLQDPDYEPERFRIGFLVKAFFADRLTVEARLRLLERYREDQQARCEEFGAIVEALAPHPEMAFMRVTALLGLRSAEAGLAWCEEVEPIFQGEAGSDGERGKRT
jgi:PadR family transcriptional regulator, regulatory protein AphA